MLYFFNVFCVIEGYCFVFYKFLNNKVITCKIMMKIKDG